MLRSLICSCSKSLVPIFSVSFILSACGNDTPETTGKDPNLPVSLGAPVSKPLQPTPISENSTPTSGQPSPSTPSAPLPSQGLDGGTPPSSGNSGSTGNADSGNNAPTQPQQPVQPPDSNPAPRLATLTISINELRNTNGNFCLSIFASSDGFPDSAEKAILAECFAVSDRSFNITIKDLPAGRYAIAGWHDENKDKKLNYNFLGIPKEGLAFSENGKPRLTPPPGPPSFDSIAFTVTDADRATPMKTSYLLDLL